MENRKKIHINERQLPKIILETYNGIIDNSGEGDLQREALRKGFNYIAYHNTDRDDLTFFDVRTSGIHFGSRKAADDRGDGKTR